MLCGPPAHAEPPPNTLSITVQGADTVEFDPSRESYARGTAVIMPATTASDPSGVEYYFSRLTDPTHVSGWQDSSEYANIGLSSDIQYIYDEAARYKSLSQNATGFSPGASTTPR